MAKSNEHKRIANVNINLACFRSNLHNIEIAVATTCWFIDFYKRITRVFFRI